MKKYTILLLSFMLCSLLHAQNKEKPDWVQQRPVNTLNFTGIGVVNKTTENYIQVAKQRALSELASEIKVEVSVNSLLNTIEDNGEVKSSFLQNIKTTATEEIENFRLIDSWQDDKEYWVYYELNRFDYEEYIEARRQRAIKSGFGFWYQGQASLQQGDLMMSIDLFTKGLEAILPVINEELTCSYEGQTINLSSEIYTSLTGVFNDVSIVVSPMSIQAAPFKGVEAPIKVEVYRNETPLRGIQLEAQFVSGLGDLSTLTPTNEIGNASFYIRNITSKQAQQEIKIGIKTDMFKSFRSGVNAIILDKIIATIPSSILTVKLEETKIKAYVANAEKNDMPALERSVKSILANNFFDVVESQSVADVVLKLDNQFKVGRKIPGELYNLVECFSTLGIQVINNRSKSTLLNYSINELRTLVPEKKSTTQAKQMAARELMKRMQREFGSKLKQITIDTKGAIPASPIEEPTPVVKPTPPIIIVIPPVVSIPEKTPIERPIQEPIQTPIEEPTSRPQAIRGDWNVDVFIEFDKLVSIGGNTRIYFKIVNKTADDFNACLHLSKITVVNERGEQLKVKSVKIGSNTQAWSIRSIVVPDLPTEMRIDVSELQSVALFGINDCDGRVVKLRNLK